MIWRTVQSGFLGEVECVLPPQDRRTVYCGSEPLGHSEREKWADIVQSVKQDAGDGRSIRETHVGFSQTDHPLLTTGLLQAR
jgi:hypothetical protein